MYDTERRAELDPIKEHPIEAQAAMYKNRPAATGSAAAPHGEATAAPVDTNAVPGH